MKALLYTTLNLVLVTSALSKSDPVRGFIRNIQVAEGTTVFFPGFSTPSREAEIPIELLLRMSEIDDTREFIKNFVYADDGNVTLSNVSSLFSHEVIERSEIPANVTKEDTLCVFQQELSVTSNKFYCTNTWDADLRKKTNHNGKRIWIQIMINDEKASKSNVRMATCKPELRTVSVQTDEKSHLFYHPSCVRVERCGGCCAHNLLACTAVESEILNVEVFVGEYTGGSKIRYKDNVIIPIEKHTKCKCLCKTQPKDCTKWQRYNRNSCSCSCSNPDAERKCYANSKNRIWNKDTCSCVCKETLDCSTGFYYDPVSCRCEVQEGRVRQTLPPWIA